MAWKFPRGHSEIKALIAQCALSGVGIEQLPNGAAPSFRFEPVENPPLHSGKPSGRGLVWAGARNPHKVKNWSPMKLSLDPQYKVPMLGDPEVLRHARYQWGEGNPVPMRQYLDALASGELREKAAEPYERRAA